MKKLTPRPPKKAYITDEQALRFHAEPTPGKLALHPTKPMATQRDLSLAYSPGVAVPVEAIAADPDTVYDYTSKGNMVAVISNGTAILGLGNLGAMASKPVMEGKSVLFKRFADIDSFDIEVEEEDAQAYLVKHLGVKDENAVVVDSKGVIYKGRKEYMDQWKAPARPQCE